MRHLRSRCDVAREGRPAGRYPLREVEDARASAAFCEVFERVMSIETAGTSNIRLAGRASSPTALPRQHRDRQLRDLDPHVVPRHDVAGVRRTSEQQQHQPADRRHLPDARAACPAPRRPRRVARCRARARGRRPRARSRDAPRPSSMSPTTSSNRSSIVTRPAVPPC